MRIAIMQPYLFPYIGYFSLIKNSEHFTFFDTPQYIRKGWINRNRLLSFGGKDVFFTVPIEKCPQNTPIKDVRISYAVDWVNSWKGQMSFYKKRAPYYEDVLKLVEKVIAMDNGYISNLAINSIVETCKYLNIPIEYDIFSEEEIVKEVQAPDEWALYIAKKKGYDEYVNPPGGKTFFDKKKYDNENIKLFFLNQELIDYNQRSSVFVPGLSIVDVMMFCSPEQICEMMEHYTME